jgi:hypothetical protein
MLFNNNYTNIVQKKQAQIESCYNQCCENKKPNINKNTLNINLYTSLDIPHNLCEVKIDPCCIPFYKYYNIDNGLLFGETACSFNNYRRYFVPNRPNILKL